MTTYLANKVEDTPDDVIEMVLKYQTINDRDKTMIMLMKILKGMGIEKITSMEAHKLRNKLSYVREAPPKTEVQVWKGHGYCD